MPIFNRKDVKGPYFQYGTPGNKYYYKAKNTASKEKAYLSCVRQVRAIHARRAWQYRYMF